MQLQSPYLSLLLLGALLAPPARPKHKVVPLPQAVGRILADPASQSGALGNFRGGGERQSHL